MDVCMDMWSYDADISYDAFIEQVETYISNLESYIGEDAHRDLEAKGVTDNTGMSWSEQDQQCEQQIQEYRDLLEYLQNDSNWTY